MSAVLRHADRASASVEVSSGLMRPRVLAVDDEPNVRAAPRCAGR